MHENETETIKFGFVTALAYRT